MIGEVVGQYKITDKLGEGGMGAVFKGLDLMLQREVAIKMLRPEISRQPELVERFRAEAITLAKVTNPGIATLYNFFEHQGNFFMVMEFVSGNTLENVIRTSGAMPWERAVPLFIMILEAVQPAHNLNILHRDIKPANIMVTNWGGVKVMDFGIARVLGAARMTREGRMVGTIEYIAPERIKGNEADIRADIYSLGVVLYEMLSGRLPFESQSEFEIMRGHMQEPPPPFGRYGPGVPQAIEAVAMRSLAKAPEHRFQSCSDFIAALHNAMLQLAVPGARTTPTWGSDASSLKPTVIAEAPGVLNRPTDVGQTPTAFTGTFTNPSQPPAMPEPRATRFDPQFQAPTAPLYQAPPPQYQAPQYQVSAPPQAPPAPSFLQSLNWKHYAAAGGLGVILLGGGLFAVKSLTGGDPPPAKPPVTEIPPVVVAPPPQTLPPSQELPGLPTQTAEKPADPKTTDLKPIDAPANGGDSEEKRAAAKAREEAAARARAAEAKRKQQVEDLLNGK